jgi:hypothetical protein
VRNKKIKICSSCAYAKVMYWDNEQPPRTHHCRTCNRCILKMDHHCPWICNSNLNWIANCVGFGNYKFFLLLLIYSSLCLLFISFTYWEEIVLVVANNTVLA